MKIFLVLLILGGAVYLAVAAIVYFAQARLLFPGGSAAAAGPLPPAAQRLRVTAAGEQLHGVHIPAVAGAAPDEAVILGFGGNAWNADAAALYLHELFPARDVVVFHFRGYDPSTGTPGAAALLADAPVVHDAVAERFGARAVVAVGFSIGSAVAARLARERRIAGLILVTPFDSLERVAQSHYPWLPVSLLLRHRMEPADALRGLAVPVALIAAERDGIIPPDSAERLRLAVGTLVFDRTLPGAGHNDIYERPEFRDAMHQALSSIEAAAGHEFRRTGR